jgi:acyl carrier protein
MEDVLEQIQDICRHVFENPDLLVSLKTTANDVSNWDSLTHIALVLEVEKRFGIKFALGELQDLKNIGSLIDLINQKIDR